LGAAVIIGLVNLGMAVAAVWAYSPGEFSFNDWGLLVSAVVSGLLVLGAVVLFRRSRLRAYRLLDGAVLVGIFVGQFFAFLDAELSAIFALFFLLLCHGVLRYLIDEEKAVRAQAAGADAAAHRGDAGNGRSGHDSTPPQEAVSGT
jgi:hypothetical protein